jgi:hypothetical protein
MALVARGVDSGTGINVLADSGATGDMQVVKLAIGTVGSQALIPATTADGMLVQISNPTAISSAVTSVIPGVGATNLGKAEDAVAASGDVGVMALAVQRTAAAADGADGDYTPLHTDLLGKLWTADVQTEDAASASGDRGSFVLAVRRDTPTSGAAAGDYHEFEVDALGRLWVSGTQAEDAAATSGDTGHFMLAVRRDTPTSGAAAGDYHEMQVDAVGGLWLAGSQIEDLAATSGDRGVFALAIRRDTAVADGAAGDYVGLHVDALGKLRTTGTYPEDSAAADAQEIVGVGAVRRDTQAIGSGTDGDWSTLNVDAFGRLRVSDRNEVSKAKTTALATNLVVKASAGKLLGFYGYSTVTQFIQVHNATSLPADAAVPDGVFPITASAPFSIWLEHPEPYTTGIVICNSTTGPTKTIGAANTWITALYE